MKLELTLDLPKIVVMGLKQRAENYGHEIADEVALAVIFALNVHAADNGCMHIANALARECIAYIREHGMSGYEHDIDDAVLSRLPNEYRA